MKSQLLTSQNTVRTALPSPLRFESAKHPVTAIGSAAAGSWSASRLAVRGQGRQIGRGVSLRHSSRDQPSHLGEPAEPAALVASSACLWVRTLWIIPSKGHARVPTCTSVYSTFKWSRFVSRVIQRGQRVRPVVEEALRAIATSTTAQRLCQHPGRLSKRWAS